MLLATDIEIFINRAQQKIATIGDSMLLQDTQGLCIESSVSLIEELSAAVDLFQNACCQPDENLSYQIIGYLNDKANLVVLPIAIFDNNCLVDAVLLPSGGFVEGPTGPAGAAATITPGTVTGLPAGSTPTITNSGTSSAAVFNFGIPAGAAGADGTDGDNGWSPIYGLVTDGLRKVIQLTGWTGGTGTAPTTVGVYIGPSGYVSDIADAVDIAGPEGAAGANGDNGYDGWTPILAVVEDGERRVLQVLSWTGGTGTPPTSGLYVSPAGFTATIGDATDIRGEAGAQGEPFTIDAAGNLSGRSVYDASGTGFTYLAYDTGDVYIKNSPTIGDWGPPISFVGDKGWSPVLNTVTDGEREVLQVSDWIGGEGLKPPSGQYVSPLGFTSIIADATNIRGDRGEFFIDAQGPLSDRGTYDANERPFTYYANDNGKIYLKNSDAFADWTTGFDWRGEQGPTGSTGSQGADAFTATSGGFTMPASAGTVNVSVLSTTWMASGQVIFIETAGYFTVTTIISPTTVTLTNLGYAGNASPTTIISTGKKVSPGGLIGTFPPEALTQGTNTLTEDLIFVQGAYKILLENLFSGRLTVGDVTAFTDVLISIKSDGTYSNATQWKDAADVIVANISASGEFYASGFSSGGTIGSPNFSIDSAGTLKNASSMPFLDPNLRILYDSSTKSSIDFENRTLNNITEQTILSWASSSNGLGISNVGATYTAFLKNTNLTANRTFEFPNDASGTLVTTAGTTFTGSVILNADPTLALGAATKSYVDNLVTGITWKNSVVAATTGNITLSGAQTIDGISVIAGDRVLVKSQSTGSQNGLYLCAAGAWTRTTDADTGAELAQATVLVEAGTVNGGTQWNCSNTTITIGVTSVTFVQIAGAGVYTNGTGIDLTGNVFSINSSVVTLTGAQALSNKTGNISQWTNDSGYLTSSTGVTTVNGASGAITNVALTTGTLAQFAATTSAQLRGVLSDETGTAFAVFSDSPTFTTQIISPVLIGSTSSAGTLQLNSTSNATKGKILLGSLSAYDEATGFHGFGTQSPAALLHLSGNFSAPFWGTSGIRIRGSAQTFTDTTSSGAVTTIYINNFGGAVINSTSVITVATAYGNVFAAPTGTGNATVTASRAILSVGDIELSAGRVRLQTGATSGIGTVDTQSFTIRSNNADRINILSSGLIGLGPTAPTPTAYLTLAAGIATASTGAPLKFTSGTNLTTAEAGAMEYDGTNLFFTKSGTTRGNVLVATAVTTELLVTDTSLTITYNGTTYKLLARA